MLEESLTVAIYNAHTLDIFRRIWVTCNFRKTVDNPPSRFVFVVVKRHVRVKQGDTFLVIECVLHYVGYLLFNCFK